ncbi:DoxX family protein [Oceanobacillus iheyensis]|nr:MauE/DoxX family redox-associated membrane protein [Oceanobacillus iheyensis]
MLIKTIFLYIFAILFMLAGIGHFVIDEFFISSMPEWVIGRPLIVYISGVIEIVLGALLLYPATRRKAGIAIAIFLVLVFPVNIYMAFNAENYNTPEIALWIRLPLQFLLIWWVMKVSKK